MKRMLVCLLLAAALAAPSLALASGGATASLRTTMTGRKAVPRGARRGRGRATIRVSGPRVCWTFGRVHGIDKPRAALINKAIPGEFGPLMVKLGKRFKSAGCVTAGPGIAQAIAQSPRSFYVTIATRRFPLGAVRGQLRKA